MYKIRMLCFVLINMCNVYFGSHGGWRINRRPHHAEDRGPSREKSWHSWIDQFLLSVSLSVCLCVSLSVCLSGCLCLCFCLSLSLYVSLCVCLSVCLSLFVSLSLFLFVFLSLSLSLTLALSLSLPSSLSRSISLYFSLSSHPIPQFPQIERQLRLPGRGLLWSRQCSFSTLSQFFCTVKASKESFVSR